MAAKGRELNITIGEHHVQPFMLENFIKPDQAVTEDVMKCYMDLLTIRSKDRCVILKKRQSTDYPRCVLKVASKELDNYVPDPETDKVIIPINWDNALWVLLVVNIKKSVFEIFSPLQFDSDNFVDEVINKNFKNFKNFKKIYRNDIVPQYMTKIEPIDTGILIMQYALALVENTSLYLEYSAYARLIICEDLLHGKIQIGAQ